MKMNGGGGGKDDNPHIGCLISLISQKDVRYEGILYSVDTKSQNIALTDVRCLGNEGRGKNFVPARDKVHKIVLFKARDIKDLTIHEKVSGYTPSFTQEEEELPGLQGGPAKLAISQQSPVLSSPERRSPSRSSSFTPPPPRPPVETFHHRRHPRPWSAPPRHQIIYSPQGLPPPRFPFHPPPPRGDWNWGDFGDNLWEDYDFEAANAAFRRRCNVAMGAGPVVGKLREVGTLGALPGQAGDTGAPSHQTPRATHKRHGYDKELSFFDRISGQGELWKDSRSNPATRMAHDAETFGDLARLLGHPPDYRRLPYHPFPHI